MTASSKRVLITGGAGFIGRNLAITLLAQGNTVTILDLPNSDYSGLPKNLKIVKANILNKKNLAGVFKNVGVIYHLAARTDLEGKTIADYKINFEGTKNVLEEIGKQKPERFVLYSTQLVVGIFNQKKFLTETEPYRTNTVYGKSKVLAERVTQELCNKYKIPYTIIRPTSVFGPFGKEPYRNFFLQIKKGNYFHIGKADNLISMVYVENLVDLTVMLATSEAAKNQIFFGNDLYPYTMKEFSETVAEYFKVKIKTLPLSFALIAAYLLGLFKKVGINVPFFPSRLRNIRATYCYDMTKSINLGYLPNFILKSGIKKTLDWYIKNDKGFDEN